MSGVVFDKAAKHFEDVRAVDDLDLEIEDREFMVLLGPSGCGKTTALRLIAGLEDVTSGQLRIGDRVVNDVEAKDRNVSMVFQSYALYPHMTVSKNIEAPLLNRAFDVHGTKRKLHRPERAERIDEAARALGLGELLDRKPAALSGGQRQRVALARAIVSRPEVFLFDEPLSNLDAKLRAATRIELVEMHQRLETTFVYVTHDQVEAMTMATRIAIMLEGRLQQVGRPQEVYDKPANLFVARFIGSPPMNTLAGTLDGEAGRPTVRIGEGTVPVRVPARALPDHGAALTVGVRPEHLHLADRLPDGTDPDTVGHLPAVVRAVEWLGHERHLVCEVAGSTVTIREPAEGSAPEPGASMKLATTAEHLHLFDGTTDERID